MTQRNFFELVANGTMNDEIIAFAKKAISEADSKRNAEKAKKAAEDEPLLAQMRGILADGQVHTASVMASWMNLSTSKVTALVKKIDGIKVSDVVKDKRIVKGYSL